MKRGLALFLTVVTAGTLLTAAGPVDPSPAVAGARLKAIKSRAHNNGASLVIEASDPVGYVAARPDPLTITIDFRNVSGVGVANSVTANAASPIAGVSVEPIESLGAPVARVRVTLSEPVAHQVRSDRNTIVIDLEKPTGNTFVRPVLSQQESGAAGAPDAMKALETVQAPAADSLAGAGGSASPVATAIDPLVALGLTGAPAEQQAPGIPALDLRNPPAAQQPTAVAAAAQPGPLQAQPAADPVAPGQTAPRFTGNAISLDFQGADLRAVLRSFSEISGLNMVIDPRVTGTVDVALREVPWDQALDIILRANGLSYRLDGTIVRIAPSAVFTAEDRAQGAAAAAAAEAGQLTTLMLPLSYSRGQEIVALLKQGNILSSRGTAFPDERTNTLIITDLPERLVNARGLIDTIDQPQKQVEIEARIVQTSKTYARALGIQWGFNGFVSPQLGNTTNLAFPNNGAIGGRVGVQGAPVTGSSVNPSTATATAVNLAASAATSAVGIQLGAVNGAFNLDVALSALEESGNGRLLSTPKVSTLNNIAAEITQGVQIPIQTVTNNTTTVQFRDAALSLRVTPQITASGTVIMQINLENSSPDFGRAVGTGASLIPPINTQRALTTVLVLDGQTTVIGGIYTNTTSKTRDQTPGLGSIPLLGWLFKRETTADENTELLIFITPRIVKSL